MSAVRWHQASYFTFQGTSALSTRGKILMATWVRPLAQRACCVLNAVISIGNSAGHSTSCR